MKTLANKVSSLLPVIELRAKVYLFALFERDDVSGKWDIVLSSDWSDRAASDAVRFVSEQLVPTLQEDELAALSRIVVIPSKEPGILAMTAAMNVAGGSVEVVDCNFNGLPIKHAFVFKCKRPEVGALGAPVEPAGAGSASN